MKKVVFTFLIFNSSFLIACAQSGWFQQYTGLNAKLWSCYFISANTGWIAGGQGYFNGGVILRTDNGGNSWSVQYAGSGMELFSVYASYPSPYIVVYAVGWSPSAGGIILRSTDGGQNWAQQNPGTNPAYELWAGYFTSSSTGWIVGTGGIILKTTNAGANWILKPSGTNRSLYSISHPCPNVGWAGGDGIILRSTDWDSTWNPVTPYWWDGWASTSFYGCGTGWFAGESNGRLIKTTDYGANWSWLGPGAFYHSIFFYNANTGWAVGHSTTGASVINATTEGGANWTSQLSGYNSDLYSVFFYGPYTGWASGYNGLLLKTTTGGVITGFHELNSEIPEHYKLYQNFPNPFNSQTRIKYELPLSGLVLLRIYDALGKEIETLVDENLKAGTYEAQWDASNYSSGIYFYRLQAGHFVETRKMALVR